MPSLPEIKIPDDFVSAGARRCYEAYAEQHKSMGMRFPHWDKLVIAVKANWKAIFRAGLGPHQMVVMNRMEKNPHSVIVSGLNETGAANFHQGLTARMTHISPVPQRKEEGHVEQE